MQNNRLLLKFKDRALKILSELEMEKKEYNLEDFEERFRILSNPVQQNVFYLWNEIIEEMITAGRTGNARANKDSYNSLKLYNKSTKLTFKEVTYSFLNKYEVFLRSRGGTDGGVSIRMRGLRALYNSAIERNLAKLELYPFKTYKISKLKGKSIKKALAMEEVIKIKNLDIGMYPHLINSRNYFIFSFYTRGMNFTDMMKLEWKQVTTKNIFYKRSKTKSNFTIKILPPVQEILKYYQESSIGTKYVFPILLKDNLEPTQVENRKHKTLQRYNKELKEIANVLEIDKPLSSYVARHSFANCLKQKGVATDIISESMGHKNLSVTQLYLKELSNSVLDEAMEILV